MKYTLLIETDNTTYKAESDDYELFLEKQGALERALGLTTTEDYSKAMDAMFPEVSLLNSLTIKK
jgi:hypothetical protein